MLEAFNEEGFVIVPELLDAATLAALSEKIDEVTENHDCWPEGLKSHLFYEWQHVKNNPRITDITPEQCGAAVRQIDNLALFDAKFAELICYRPLLDLMTALFETTEFSFMHLVGRPKVARYGNGIMNFHRDTPNEALTSGNTITAILCLDEMTEENGPTVLVRGSHKVSDEEANRPYWMHAEESSFNAEAKVTARCPAGGAVVFHSKIIHGALHNRSQRSRRTIISVWSGPDALPTSASRFPYQGIKPASRDPLYQKQLRMTFPRLFE